MFHFQGVATEDYNINTPGNHVELRVGTPAVGTPAVGTPDVGIPIVGTPKPTKSKAVEDEEPPLNEDDDDDDDLDDLEQGEEEPNIQHLVLAQFDKDEGFKNSKISSVDIPCPGYRPIDSVDYMIFLPSHGAIIGAWLGARPMPLDWERPSGHSAE